MKRTIAVVVVIGTSLFALSAHAQSGTAGMGMKGDTGMKGMGMKSETGAHQASGTVTKVEPEKNAVTVKHGPVESMKWPAMTMRFKVKDKKVLDKMKPGIKVDFTFVQSGKDYTITDVR